MNDDAVAAEAQPLAKAKAVALYPDDIQDVERIRNQYELDSFSQAIRRAIRMAVRVADDERAEKGEAA